MLSCFTFGNGVQQHVLHLSVDSPEIREPTLDLIHFLDLGGC